MGRFIRNSQIRDHFAVPLILLRGPQEDRGPQFENQCCRPLGCRQVAIFIGRQLCHAAYTVIVTVYMTEDPTHYPNAVMLLDLADRSSRSFILLLVPSSVLFVNSLVD